MNQKSEKVRKDFITWTEENRRHLPLNSTFWEFRIVHKKKQDDIQHDFVELGKYHTRLQRGIPFYKPYSKLVIWNLNG